MYEEKTRGFDVKLREHPASILSLAPCRSLSLPLSLKVRVYIAPSIQLTVREKQAWAIHYIIPLYFSSSMAGVSESIRLKYPPGFFLRDST